MTSVFVFTFRVLSNSLRLFILSLLLLIESKSSKLRLVNDLLGTNQKQKQVGTKYFIIAPSKNDDLA